MKIRINGKRIAAALSALTLLCSCSDDRWESGCDRPGDDAVTLMAEYPSFATRAADIPEKRAFEQGDALHVSAVFTIEQPGNIRTQTTVYNCFVYDRNGRWVSTAASADEVMKWPWNAVSGTFTAYYMPGSSGSLAVGGKNAYTCRLNGAYAESDPLYATDEEVPYGHTVNFTFAHRCTRLVFTEVKSGYVDKFGLRTVISPSGDSGATGKYKQMNVCALTRNEDNTLEFAFLQKPDADGNVSVMSSADGNRVLVFHLQPGDYSHTEVCYANDRPYIELNMDELKNCEAGHSYEIDVSHTPGIINKEDDDPWKDPSTEDLGFDIDIDAFLQAVEDGKIYSQENPETHETVQITGNDDSGHLTLLYNLDFKKRPYTPKILPATCYFHGNYHYIKGNIRPLFKELSGTIDNLEIRDTEIAMQSAGSGQAGALAEHSSGKINNIRLNGCRITGYAPESSLQVLSVGALVGEQSGGTIDNATLMGNIVVEVLNEQENGVAKERCNATVDLGGVVGQTAGTIGNVTLSAGADGNPPSLVVSNRTQGYGIVSTGGLVGLSAGTIGDCIISCTVDCAACRALQNCAGGLIGRNRSGSMTNCTVSGTVSGGISESNGSLDSYSLTGGICGYITDIPIVEECYAFCTVEETDHTASDHTVVATGGGMGFINSTAQNIRSCRVIGTVSGYTIVGSFVGQCRGTTAQILQNDGNRASDTNKHDFCGKQ